MSALEHRSDDLVVSGNFIRAVRDAGYLSLSTALAELVDNALEADARHVDIDIRRDDPSVCPIVTVTDDGHGMTASELRQCLRFGGSSRFGSRASFGRFGMGLPAASLSQSSRVRVTSARRGEVRRAVTLDAAAIVSGVAPNFTPVEVAPASDAHGTAVEWLNCDRVEYRRLGWLQRAVIRRLGRLYREPLRGGTSITVNGKAVPPADPLLLETELDGVSADLPFPPMRFAIPDDVGGTSEVTVRFSLLPVEAWAGLDQATKRRVGIIGGGGISVLRAGREVADGWMFTGGKRKENYDDWWRCEIQFPPTLDDAFGITNTKQGIRPTRALNDTLEPYVEATARLLNGRVRRAFEEVKFRAATERACTVAAAADGDLPAIRNHVGSPLTYRICAEPLPIESMLRTELSNQRLDLTLNVDHPAFAALYAPLQSVEVSTEGGVRTSFELMLLSLGRTLAHFEADGTSTGEFVTRWSRTFGRMLRQS